MILIDLCWFYYFTVMSSRLSQYKSKALDNSELRRRREEEGVQIRKAKRDEQVTILCNYICIYIKK